MTNNVIEWAESCIGRKLTDAEKEIVRIDCEISERLNVGSVKALKKYGIEIGGMSMTENEAQKWLERFEWDDSEETSEALATICEALQEYPQFKAIGAIEEFKALKEKSVAKKPSQVSKAMDKDKFVGLIGRCPHCGSIVAEDNFVCEDCFQVLDWSE